MKKDGYYRNLVVFCVFLQVAFFPLSFAQDNDFVLNQYFLDPLKSNPKHSEPVTILGIEIPGLHQRDFRGKYDRIILSVFSDKTKVKLINYPPIRAFKVFERCTNCCISPANKNPEFYPYANEYLATDPMGVAKIYVWSKPGHPDVYDLSLLQGKRVGSRQGMPYGKTFESSGITPIPVRTIEQNIKKLMSDKIDYFIAYTPDAYTAFNSLRIPPFPHALSHPIGEHEDSILCKGIDKSFVQYFNQRLEQVSASQSDFNLLKPTEPRN